MAKLILLAVLYAGRIDTPFVAEKVGHFGFLDLESYHHWFLTDVLAVEAHRHPYIETLGSMYLMKLKYRNEFMDAAGGKWRELFVCALMPWLHKYRRKNQRKIADNLNAGANSDHSLMRIADNAGANSDDSVMSYDSKSCDSSVN